MLSQVIPRKCLRFSVQGWKDSSSLKNPSTLLLISRFYLYWDTKIQESEPYLSGSALTSLTK